jgi:hypothetical protein
MEQNLQFNNSLAKVYTLKSFDQFYPNNPLTNQNSYPNHHWTRNYILTKNQWTEHTGKLLTRPGEPENKDSRGANSKL